MYLDRNVVQQLTIPFHPRNYVRVMRSVYANTPMGLGFGESRFSSPVQAFKILYVAKDVGTSIAETIIRDNFEGQPTREIEDAALEEWSYTEFSADVPLKVLDLRSDGAFRLGITTDVSRAKGHHDGQVLSENIYHNFDIEGLLFTSRFTASPCLAVYERAVDKLKGDPTAVPITRHPNLISVLSGLNIKVIK